MSRYPVFLPFSIFLALAASLPAAAQVTGRLGACGQPLALTAVIPVPLEADFGQASLPVELPRSEARYVEFTLASAQSVVLLTRTRNGDPVLTLYDATGTAIGWDDDSAGNSDAYIATSLEAGSYCAQVRVLGSDPIDGAVSFAIGTSDEALGFAPPPSMIADSLGPCGDPALTDDLVGISPGFGSLAIGSATRPETGRAWFRLNLDSPQALRIEAVSDVIDTVLELWTEAGDYVTENDDDPELGSGSRLLVNLDAGGYCLVLRGFGDGQGDFTLTLAEDAGGAYAEPFTSGDANGASASDALAGGPAPDAVVEDLGALGDAALTSRTVNADPVLWAGFTLDAPATVGIGGTSLSGDFEVVLYDAAGTALGGTRGEGSGGGTTQAAFDIDLAPGSYRVGMAIDMAWGQTLFRQISVARR